MGWKMFLHSVRMVLDNLGVALRLSLLLYLVQVVFTVFLFTSPGGGDPMQQTPAGAGEMFLLSLFAVVSSLWIAVGWHRFVPMSNDGSRCASCGTLCRAAFCLLAS